MKYFILLVFGFISNNTFGQDNAFYYIAFNTKSNFDFLEFYSGKIPEKFQILDSTIKWNDRIFYLEEIDFRSKKIIDSLNLLEYHSYHNTYLFKDENLDKLFSENDKIFLKTECKKFESKKIVLKNEIYSTIQNTEQLTGFYFFVSEPLFSNKKNYAFLNIHIKNKSTFMDDDWDEYYGTVTLIFRKSNNDVWEQIGVKKNLIM